MLFRLDLDVTGGCPPLRAPRVRYTVLRAVASAARRNHVVVHAFGFESQRLRLLLDAGERGLTSVARAAKVSAANLARQEGLPWRSEHTWRVPHDGSLLSGIGWCHRVAHDPLATPWTSHRDLMGFRLADFFDPEPTLAKVSREEIHRACGLGALPTPPGAPPRVSEPYVLARVAAAVHGVLPADPGCRVTFAHLARSCGVPRQQVARHLAVGDRRLRQILAHDTDALVAAVTSLVDPRLAAVP